MPVYTQKYSKEQNFGLKIMDILQQKVFSREENEIIKNNQSFFAQLSEIDSITIVGWSAGSVDIPYLKKVSESVKSEAIWHVYWHDKKAEDMLKNAFDEVGIALEYRDFKSDTKFWD